MTPIEQIAHKHFGITLPIDRTALRSLYRAKARILHSDFGGTDAAFQALDSAYKLLLTADGVFTDSPALLFTEEGTPLSDLGRGVGSRKNGAECSECGGCGYHARKRRNIVWSPKPPCTVCVAVGSTWGCQRCRYGGFSHTDKVLDVYSICAPCQGKGEIELLNPVIPKAFLTSGHYVGQKARKRLGL